MEKKTHQINIVSKVKLNKPPKITLFILTRDFRTKDALTLYRAYDEAIKSKTNLCVIFRFSQQQISKENNPFFCSNAVQFMMEALEELNKEINYYWIEPISDEELKKFLSELPVNKIFIARDFTPFARQRFEFLSTIHETIEIDDITVHPINKMKVINKLAYFIDFVKKIPFPKIEEYDVDWKKVTCNNLENYLLSHKLPSFVHQGKITLPYGKNKDLAVHPKDFSKLMEKFGENIKGYSVKKIREQLGSPKVSYLSTFIKFGLISIRAIHQLAKESEGPSAEDKKDFERELYFKDFFYTMAWNRPEDVFEKPNWQQKNPKFINEEDLLAWKRQQGVEETISKEERKEIEKSKEIYDNWTEGVTEYKLINASINQMTSTGYMLNRTRMLTVSYLTQDKGLWWKYAEQFFANHLIDYDWTINTMNHQNIAKVGMYPKYTQNFSIQRQESMNKRDKEKYYKQNCKESDE